ncbi:DUF6350 family protein [Streptomyces sp. NPDC048604]|uniref:cell division protein PerM n=1 Tax=Streptomyces sp. NPDC048604 TaxID=3365578 RepID=UPI003710D430
MGRVTHLTEQGTAPATDALVRGARSAVLVSAVVRGGVAAGLGLGALAVLVTVLWISSPYPDSGPGGALHVAAGLWLLAHGVDLVRTDTLTGVPAPLGIAPLLLVALPGWLAHRAARDAMEQEDGRPRLAAAGAVGAVTGGYLLVGAAVVLYAAGGPFPADPLAAAFWLPGVTLAAAGAGAWTASGRTIAPLARRVPRAGVALRSAAVGLLTLLAGGAVLVAVSLVWHAAAVADAYTHLAGEWSGRLAVALLIVVLVPDAAVWGAAYGLGPGVMLGAGAVASPYVVMGAPAVPTFPLLAALPQPGPTMWAHWLSVAVPLAAGVALGRRTGRVATTWTARATTWTALQAAGLCGVVTALLAAASGGPLGVARLAAFGPVWWATGAAAALWTAALGVPVALGVRAWFRRAEATAAEDPTASPEPAGNAAPVPASAAVTAVEPEPLAEEPFEPYDLFPATWETPSPEPPSPDAPAPEPASPEPASLNAPSPEPAQPTELPSPEPASPEPAPPKGEAADGPDGP